MSLLVRLRACLTTLRVMAVLAVAAAAAPASAAAQSPNLLSGANPSFRYGTQGWSGFNLMSKDWSVDGDAASGWVYGVRTNNDVSVFSEFVPVTAGETYSARVSANIIQSMAGLHVRIEWWDNGSSSFAQSTGSPTSGTGAKTASVTATAPTGATRARLRIYDDGTGTLNTYIDGAMLVVGSVPTSFYFAPNLLSPLNPSFRFGSEGWAGSVTAYTGWSIDGDSASVRLYGQPTVPNDVSAFSGYVAVQESQTYSARISAYVLQAMQQGIRVRIEWRTDTAPLSVSTGTAISGTGAKTASVTATAPPGATRARLRIFDDGTGTAEAYLDGALFVAGDLPSNFYFTQDSGPYAKVQTSEGNVMARFGSTYQPTRGGQIQKAINYTQCANGDGCARPAANAAMPAPLYWNVVIDPGTFTLTSGATDCHGIFVYGRIRVTGATGMGTVIEDQLPIDCKAPDPEASDSGAPRSVVFVADNPNPYNTITGHALAISQLVINSDSTLPRTKVGFRVAGISGPGLAVNLIYVTGAEETGIRFGDTDRPVVGTASSPALLLNSRALPPIGAPAGTLFQDGIVVGGSYIQAAGNFVEGATDHGIAVYNNTTGYNAHNQVTYNTVNRSEIGISLDGHIAVGDDNTVDNNSITNGCIGIIVSRQQWAKVAYNTITGNFASSQPPSNLKYCDSPQHDSTGILIKNVITSHYWRNTIDRNFRGIWLFNQLTDQPGYPQVATQYNWIGVQPGTPAVAPGNDITNAVNGIEATEAVPAGTPGSLNLVANAFEGNRVSSVSGYPCRTDVPQTVGSISPNTFATCPYL